MKTIAPVIAFGVLVASFYLRVMRGTPVDCDFTQFWAMARIPYSDRGDPAKLVDAENRALAGTGVQPVPYIRPQAFAIPLAPLRFLPLVPAYRIWASAQFLCLCIFLLLIRRAFHTSWFFIGLVALFSPAMHGISLGQDVALLALLLLCALLALREMRDTLAGFFLTAALFKFQLLWAMPIFLVAVRRYRALAVVAAGGTVLAIISCLIMSPSAYIRYVTHVSDYLPGIPSGEMARGLHGMVSVWIFIPVVLLLIGFASRRAKALDLDSSFCQFLTISVFCSWYVMHHDYTLLLIPIFFTLERGGKLLKYVAATSLIMPPLWDYKSAMLATVAIFCVLLLLELPPEQRKLFSKVSALWRSESS